jgi:hypothetical protein
MRTMSATSLLVLQTLAQEAAQWVVTNESALPPTDRKVFTGFDLSNTDENAINLQLATMSRRFFADTQDLAAQRADDLYQLFNGMRAAGTPRAWMVTLTAMLSDPEMAYF